MEIFVVFYDVIDYHIHTKLCKHAIGEPFEYCEQAIKNGIEELGFSDHFPVNYQPTNSIDIKTITMRESEIPDYMDILKSLTARFKQIKIRKAFEVDYIVNENLFFNKYISLYDELDYIIGSIHFIGDKGVDQQEFISHIENYGVEKLWEAYFNNLEAYIKQYSQYIDIIGHLDLPKKFYGRLPDNLFDRAKDILKLIKDNELVVEINTSGYDKPVKEQYPSEKIIDAIYEQKIEITMGSDAHQPSEVGRYFAKTAEMLKSKGFSKLIKFDRHKKEYSDL